MKEKIFLYKLKHNNVQACRNWVSLYRVSIKILNKIL